MSARSPNGARRTATSVAEALRTGVPPLQRHVRVGSHLFTHTLFPVYIAALLSLGLWLRDPRLRAILATTA